MLLSYYYFPFFWYDKRVCYMSVWACHCKSLTRCCVRCTSIFMSLSKCPCKLFSSSLTKQSPAGIHALRSASPCSWLQLSPPPVPLSLSASILYVPLFSSPILPPILLSFLLLIALRLLPVEVNMIGVCVCVSIAYMITMTLLVSI